MDPSIKLQAQVKMQCENLKNDLISMKNWEKEMREKEKNFKNNLQNMDSNQPPVRSHIDKMEEYEKSAKIPIISDSLPDENKLNELKRDADNFKDSGNKLVKAQKWQEAIEMYTKAIEIYDQDTIYFCNRSLCHLKLQNYVQCVKDTSKAIELDDKYVKAYFRRMQAREAQGEFILALKDCQKVLEYSPANEKEKFHTDYDRIHNKIVEEERKREKQKIKWSRMSKTAKVIKFIDKPAHLRSKKPLKKLQVQEKQIAEKIPEAIIDKIFNNNTGETHPEPESDSQLFKKNFLLKSKSVDEKLAKKCSEEPQKITSKDDLDLKTEKSKLNPDENSTKPAVLDLTTKVSPNSKPKVQSPVESGNEEKKGESPEKTASQIKSPVELSEDFGNLQIDVPNVPKSGPQFNADWLELNETQKFIYLRNINAEKLAIGRLLGPLLDSTLLSEILFILQKYFIAQKLPILRFLLELGKNREMIILAFFLSADDKKILENLINHLIQFEETSQEDIDAIRKNFSI